MDKKFGIKHVVAMGIGTALFVVLTNVQIPVGFIPNTALQTRAAVLAFFLRYFWPRCRRCHRSDRSCTGRCSILRKRMVELGIPGRCIRHHRWSVCCEV